MRKLHFHQSTLKVMDAAKIEWLRYRYREVPLEGPCPKKIKMSDLHKQLEEQYSPEKFTQYAASHIVRKAFPNAESKIAGKSRTKHIFGIAPVEDATLESSASTIQAGGASSCTPTPVAVLLETEQVRNKQLMERIQLLEARVQELEKTCPVTLIQQADQLQHGSLVVCGQDTPDHFQNFSIDGIIQELQEQAPDMYKLFMQLCDVHQNVPPDSSTSIKEIKGVTSLCTVLNARSNRVKGVQLLISMMLIARSTSKQVHVVRTQD